MTNLHLSPAKLRNLDAVEKAFWLFDQYGPAHFCLVAEVSGPTSIGLWRHALGHVGRQTPFVGTQILVDQHGEPYFSVPEPRDVPLTLLRGSVDDWPRHLGIELSEPFEVATDVLVRARLLHDSDRCALILTFHHSISDGSSAAFFMRNVLTAAGGTDVLVSTATMSVEQAVEDLGLPAVEVPADGDSSLLPPALAGPRTAPAVAKGRFLTAPATMALRERARQERTTVHAALTVAAADAFAAMHPGHEPNPPRVFSPIDARRRLLEPNDALGVFVSGIVTRLDASLADFWSAARSITSKFATLSDPASLAAKIAVVRPAIAGVSSAEMAANIVAQVFGAEVLLTNLTAIELPERLGGLTVDHLWGPALSFNIESEQVVGVVTVGGRLHLLHTSRTFADGLLDRMVDTLTAATDAEH